MIDYQTFLHSKSQIGGMSGFEPVWMPESLFNFQGHATGWAIRKGRAAIVADCGLGKSPMQLTWAENIVRKTNGRVVVFTPLAVGRQTVKEGTKFGIECAQSRDGILPNCKIAVTNYEQIGKLNASDFEGVVCDESSILKNVSGARRKQITRFLSKMKYRLLCTATAAPNDYVELGTSSEALGELNHSDMLKIFFQQLDDKGQKSEQKKQNQAEQIIANDPNYFKKLAYRVAQTIGQWRLKHHAVEAFWRWVASWSMVFRMPSDIGFSDDGFVLPKLIENDHIITPKEPPPGRLFNVPAFGLAEEREERKRTIRQRCEFVADLVNHKRAAAIWCHTNDEGDMLSSIIPSAEQIAGKTPDEQKIELFDAFSSGQLLKLVIKPKIGAFGLNWQHCNHVVTFASHSYEQHYQLVRRCWRFGQKRDVQLDVVATEGELRVLANMRRKSDKADAMFTSVVREMNNATRIESKDDYKNKMEVPSWV